MPTVDGLLSELDLRVGRSPSIVVTTYVHATQASVRQIVAWMLATICALVASLLVAVEHLPRRPWATILQLGRGAARRATLVDGVVGLALLGWWLISPAFWDDGWVQATEKSFSASGGFSTYYNAFGANLPLGYWLDWLQHWLTQSTSALVFLRIPALLCLAATWVLCRWVLARLLRPVAGEDQIVLWVLATTFVVGAMAWGMTLRPEPTEALLATGVLACTVRFLERGTTAPILTATILIALALAAHYEGIVSLAPLLVVGLQLLGWARARLGTAVTLIVSTSALLCVLVFVDSDLTSWRADVRTASAYGTVTSWRTEPDRYALLFNAPSGTPIRRASVALMVLAVLAFLTRRILRKAGQFNLPTSSLAVGLLLLIAVPDKLPWHFGALLGLAAVAVASETARVRQDAARSRGWQARPLLVIAIGMLAATWCWDPRLSWNPFDLRTLNWVLGFERTIPLTELVILPLLLMFGLALGELLRGRSTYPWLIPWRVSSWTALTVAVPLIAFTYAVLLADSVKTSSWTLARQNLASFTDSQRCGLSDYLGVRGQTAFRRDGWHEELASDLTQPGSRSLIFPVFLTYFPCVKQPRLQNGIAEVPKFILGTDQNPGLYGLSPIEGYRTSPFGGLLDLYPVEHQRLAKSPFPWGDVVLYQVNQRIPGAARVSPTRSTIIS
jgi:hypothetical protein